MPEVDTYSFSHKELLELLIKAAGVHEGEWMLQVNFKLSAGNFGPDESSISPGTIVVVSNLGLTKAPKDAPSALTLDAAKINPAST